MSSRKNNKAPGPIRIWVEYLLFLPPCALVRALSLKNAYRFARIIAFLFYWIDFKHRKRVITHLLHSGIVSDRAAATVLAKKNFLHMVKVFVEILKYDQIVTPENFKNHIRYDNFDQIVSKCNLIRKNTPVIVVSMHLGNWELGGGSFALYHKMPLTSIMRPLANYKIGNFFYSKRESSLHETVSKEKGIRPLLQALLAGRSIVIVADQHAAKREGVEISYFGHPARAHMTPALLHLKTGNPILPLVLVREDDEFHFRFIVNDPICYTPSGNKEEDIRNITQLYTDCFEKMVRQYPDQWLWAHRRWLDCGRRHAVSQPGETPPFPERNKT